jgi:hypothetical protein
MLVMVSFVGDAGPVLSMQVPYSEWTATSEEHSTACHNQDNTKYGKREAKRGDPIQRG